MAFKTLARYLTQRRKRRAAAAPSGPSRLVRVQVEPRQEAEGELTELTVIVPGGRRIAVPRGFDEDLLRQLLAVLEQA